MKSIVIVGAGQAGGQAAMSLRQGGFEGELTLVGDEPYPPYQRPPLSKQFLAGGQGLDRVLLRPEAFYAEKGVALRLAASAARIDRAARELERAGGECIGYDALVLATGSRVRRLGVPGADLDGVCYLRSIADAENLKARLAGARRLAVVGGGYIGLEVASVARSAGLEVTVLETADRLLARVAAPAISAFFENLHARHGVTVRTRATVTGFEGPGRVEVVTCDDGTPVPADLVLVGIGIVPNVELAHATGLTCDDGIVVDESCRTEDPAILAAGDCTRHPNAWMGGMTRLESVPNAIEQGRVVASVLCGEEARYEAEPWFWSDQYDVKLQMVGLARGAQETVTRGEPGAGPFLTFHLRDGVVVGVDAVDSVRDFLACRRLVASRARPEPAALADPGIALKSLA
jgi:3-phenylpropionate/trans-cinnamate dioxygenase ferredoxin reductase subunit